MKESDTEGLGGCGEELPLPAPVKPDVSLSTHPAYYLDRRATDSSPSPGWSSLPSRSPRPSLPGHYSPFIATTPQSAPVRRIRYSRLLASGLGVLPFPPSPVRPRHDWFPSSAQEPAPRFCPVYAGHRLARSEIDPPGLSEERASALVLVSSFYLSTRPRGFAFAQLRGAYLTGVSLPFSATLKTPALDRRPLQWFGIPLSQSRSRRAREQTDRSLLHLLHSIALLVATFTRRRPLSHSRHTRPTVAPSHASAPGRTTARR